MLKRNLIYASLILVGLIVVYWFKCQNAIDLVKDVSFKNIPPFNLLQNHNPYNIVFAQEADAELLADSFASEVKHGEWDNLWMREEGTVTVGHDSKGHDDSPSLVITSRSSRDWSLQHKNIIKVSPGEVFSFSGWVRTSGKAATGTLSVVLYGADKQVLQWHYAGESVTATPSWWFVERSFVIPDGVTYIRFRLTGWGEGKVWFDEISFKKGDKTVPIVQDKFQIENAQLVLVFDTGQRTLTVLDKRVGKKWETPLGAMRFAVKEVRKEAAALMITLVDMETMESLRVDIHLAPNAPEFVFSLDKETGVKFRSVEFPPVFEIGEQAQIVLPLAEGFLFDQSTAVKRMPSNLRYKGGWPLAFVGVLDGGSGWMEIIETPNDFELVKEIRDSAMILKNRWLAQKESFGYKRQVRYVFLDEGGYVAMAKRYRQYAQEKGLLKTLSEKNNARRQKITKLVGGVNVWYWGKDKIGFILDLSSLGVKKALLSNLEDSSDIRIADSLGYLISRYDIYQDVWPPIYHEVTDHHDGWPEDLVLDRNGDWVRGWVIKKGSEEYPGGVICSVPGLARAKQQIVRDLNGKPYTARFIDTTTSSPWRECYNSQHPTTRSEDLKNKMALLDFCSNALGLVTGSEDGVDVAVAVADYFEGMMSPGFARLPDSGRNVAAVKYVPQTEEFLKFQVGEQYRIPLWELVFHDAAVATWYWDDSSNRIPEVWWRRDLFNILYGNMPLWAIRDWDHWRELKSRFLASYQNVSPVFEKVGFMEMTGHRFVTEDHTVQETTFSGDVRIVVNFGQKEFGLTVPDFILPPHGFVVFEGGKVWKHGIAR